VYCLALAVGNRHSQYDLWHPNPLADPEPFRGRTMIHVGPVGDPLRAAFEEVGPSIEVEHRVEGLHVASWQVTICRGYRGFPALRPGGY
jgi:hypothetical protein